MPTNKPCLIRVVVVDDSQTVRDMLIALLESSPNMQVVGTGSNGEEAVRLVSRLRPDVVTMDVRMPRMDGLEATRRIMRETPTPVVIVTGSLTHTDVDLTFNALRAGALTVVAKPGLSDPVTGERLVLAVRLMAGVGVIHHWGRQAAPAVAVQPPGTLQALQGVQIVGIAASTGGPGALATVLHALPAEFSAPILVVQHVTPGFAAGLAEWLDDQTALSVRLAGHGDSLRPGTVLLAPDDYHLQAGHHGTVVLSKEPPYKGLRPSANYLFHSLARVYGPGTVGIVLTGMGDDGADGLEALHRCGGQVIAQDAGSCVVYGMPQEAVNRGVVDAVMPPAQIAGLLTQLQAPSIRGEGRRVSGISRSVEEGGRR